ncbi:hypothetical protein MYU51_021767 [Penicillium brevicompactum]
MVEQELGALREVLLTSDASDAAQAEADRGTLIILSFARDANNIGRAMHIIRREQGILELLPHVEKNFPILHQAGHAHNTSDTGFEEARANIRARIRRIEALRNSRSRSKEYLYSVILSSPHNTPNYLTDLLFSQYDIHHLLLAGLAASEPSIYFDTDKAKLFIAMSSGIEVEPSVLTDKSLLGPSQGPLAIPVIDKGPGNFNPMVEFIHGEERIIDLLRYVEKGIANFQAGLAEHMDTEVEEFWTDIRTHIRRIFL